jgi:hypothetical protein
MSRSRAVAHLRGQLAPDRWLVSRRTGVTRERLIGCGGWRRRQEGRRRTNDIFRVLPRQEQWEEPHCATEGRTTGPRGTEHEREHPLRVPDGQLLRDLAAHRCGCGPAPRRSAASCERTPTSLTIGASGNPRPARPVAVPAALAGTASRHSPSAAVQRHHTATQCPTPRRGNPIPRGGRQRGSCLQPPACEGRRSVGPHGQVGQRRRGARSPTRSWVCA